MGKNNYKPTVEIIKNGHKFLIDKEDLDILIKTSTFFPKKTGTNIYIVTMYFKNKIKKNTFLHTDIMRKHFGEIPTGMCTDHINRNGLDNRKKNLRLVTFAQNIVNSRKTVRNKKSSKYKGVHFNKAEKKWKATFGKKHLGVFPTEKKAHEAYVRYGRENYGEFFHDGT